LIPGFRIFDLTDVDDDDDDDDSRWLTSVFRRLTRVVGVTR